MAKLQGKTKIVCEKFSVTLPEIKNLSEKVAESMKSFIGPQYLADRIENGYPVWEVRPNAVTAVSLPFDFTTKDVMKRVWKMTRDALLTPYGLRTLDPLHPAYKQKYIGSQKQRDLAYHQGTVWPYLLGDFAKLSAKVLSAEYSHSELFKEIGGYVWAFRDAFMRGEFASVAEVWDGSDPYFPKGCPAQAWSVFALLEIENMLKV
jgi:glycogen debranching enzyme